MEKYEFNATNLIAETFEKHGIKFQVVNMHGQEEILAGFSVDNGPNVVVKFISRDDDNDVAVRIFGLVSKTSQKKHSRLLEVCNMLNRKIRFVKFYLDFDGDINVEYDFPTHTGDDCIGEMAFEIFVRIMQILDSEYELFAKALYTDEELLDEPDESNKTAELLRRLEELKSRLDARQGSSGTQDDTEDASDSGSKEASDEADDILTFLRMLAGKTDSEEIDPDVFFPE